MQDVESSLSSVFLSTPSARRATAPLFHFSLLYRISIHALREEGDSRTAMIIPAEGDFYPRPPRGGRPKTVMFSPPLEISIHALREEGDLLLTGSAATAI